MRLHIIYHLALVAHHLALDIHEHLYTRSCLRVHVRMCVCVSMCWGGEGNSAGVAYQYRSRFAFWS